MRTSTEKTSLLYSEVQFPLQGPFSRPSQKEWEGGCVWGLTKRKAENVLMLAHQAVHFIGIYTMIFVHCFLYHLQICITSDKGDGDVHQQWPH